MTNSNIKLEVMDGINSSHQISNSKFSARIKNTAHTLSLALKSLGVVYGDIGTSPLYVINTIFVSQPSTQDIIGACSLILYSLFILVTIKYVVFILQADDNGEGGTFALCSLLVGKNSSLSAKGKQIIIIISLFGAAFVIADGIITPAISVLSAVEGIETYSNGLAPYVLPITMVILALLFLFQWCGTSKVGASFGPIMLLWFLWIGGNGIHRMIGNPRIFAALNPWEGILYFVRNKAQGFLSLGSVFLAVTGLEALFADLGHFGKLPIRIGWLTLVFPALVFNYMGQSAYLLNDPSNFATPFFSSTPTIFFWPVLVLSTIATVIASQAMISGSFSLISQAINLGFFPPVKVKHTSKTIHGQIYIPLINYMLMIMTLAVVGAFRHSATITRAYGVTVSSVMILTTAMYMLVIRFNWKLPLWKVLPFGIFFVIDGAFWTSNLAKVPNGGWVPLVFGVVFGFVMVCWHIGEKSLAHAKQTHFNVMATSLLPMWLREHNKEKKLSTEEIDHQNSSLEAIQRTSGMGVFLTSSKCSVPISFHNMIKRIHCAPEIIVLMTVEIIHQAVISPDSMLSVENHGDNVFSVFVRQGYAQGKIFLDKKLEEALSKGIPSLDDVTYYVNRDHVSTATGRYLKRVPLAIYCRLKKVFSGIPHNIHTPVSETVEIAVRVILGPEKSNCAVQSA